MYRYVAVTNSTIENCRVVLRIDKYGVIEQYKPKARDWKLADRGMSGIYSGDVESEPITKKQAENIIRRFSDGGAD